MGKQEADAIFAGSAPDYTTYHRLAEFKLFQGSVGEFQGFRVFGSMFYSSFIPFCVSLSARPLISLVSQ
jgi:hypothetical protein